MADTPAFSAAVTSATDALPEPKSLIPSSQITLATPDRERTSRSSRASAEGPPDIGLLREYALGPLTWLPPMPAFTTATLSP